jgi:UDP-N-acetylglucosamine 2-epimerase
LRQPAGFALIHGDTLSTLVGAHLARRLGLKVGLVEAGLSSGHLLDPFPEELIRRHVEVRSDLLFVPDEIAEQNLKARNLSGRVINTRYNTGRDALLAIAGQQANRAEAPEEPSGTILTLHRAETLSRPGRLKSVIGHVLRLAPSLAPVHFYLHEPTSKALARTGLLAELERAADISLRPLAGYKAFVNAMAKSRYVLTDGGSIQEEASYLSKPCIILRRATERPHGIGNTAMLTSMDVRRDLDFLAGVDRRNAATGDITSTVSASGIVVDACYG